MANSEESNPSDEDVRRRSRRLSSRAMLVLRRMHLYVGLFLLPWVFLYGITGAMFNHYSLFPNAKFAEIDAAAIAETSLKSFPSTDELSRQVVDAIQSESPESEISLDDDHGAEFVNDVILQVNDDGVKHAVHIDPIQKSAWIASTKIDKYRPKPLLQSVRNVNISPNPYQLAKDTIPNVLNAAGLDSSAAPKPMGWCKLNFLATVDGERARVTYVLRDGHVDITKYDGTSGMSLRAFFLRLHTSHGQPPHWNGRMVWSVFVDVMAIAMVTWGLTGLVMWWQIKRTRLIGGAIMILSLSSAVAVYFGMVQFYATTKL